MAAKEHLVDFLIRQENVKWKNPNYLSRLG